MQRNQKNTWLLENIAEISYQLLSDTAFNREDVDSIDIRFQAIDAALVFHEEEAKALRRATEDERANYDWYKAVIAYRERISSAPDATQAEMAKRARASLIMGLE